MAKLRFGRAHLYAPALLALASCSPAPSDTAATASPTVAAAQAVHGKSGLPVLPLTIRSDGQEYGFKVELAVSRFEQAKGLMFRTVMAPDEGMLFPFDPPREASFWMKNTVIPLDIIFIGPDRRILNVEAEAVPYSTDQRTSQGEAIAVLELIGGRAAELGIEPGDKVDW